MTIVRRQNKGHCLLTNKQGDDSYDLFTNCSVCCSFFCNVAWYDLYLEVGNTEFATNLFVILESTNYYNKSRNIKT